jgi:PIN domain nuclease of toxin-antitoxin system
MRRSLFDNGYVELAVTGAHAAALAALPQIHKDPFDRMLVAQAIVEGFTLLTSDRRIAKYPGSIRLV